MSNSTKKRTLDAFFKPPAKKTKVSEEEISNALQNASPQHPASPPSTHPRYPFPIASFPHSITSQLLSFPSTIGKPINDQVHLDLLYFQPYIPNYLEREVFEFLRAELPFYRVEYKIKRGSVETQVRTPRWTTVFGLDETSRFDENGIVVDAKTGDEVKKCPEYNKNPPRPIPKCVDDLRLSTEAATGSKFNFCLVNYYASGADSISYHSDDERFLGRLPTIASFSLGSMRDFLMKHKPVILNDNTPPLPETKPLRLPLGSGDMVLMKGETQANWLHSIPKRTGKNADDGGRINITFRRAMVKGGTENYYNYNVGKGPVYKWNNAKREMQIWKE